MDTLARQRYHLRRMNDALLAIASGLAAAISWGTGDFAGGLASRRAPAIRVVLASQAIGTVALLALGLLLREPRPAAADLAWGAVAGIAGGLGLLLLYLSLAVGKMGVVAPVTAVAAGGIPLMVGVFTEGLPAWPQVAGFLLALLAIWIISRPDALGSIGLRDLAVPLLAGVGFGVFLALIGRVGDEQSFVWPLVAARVASMTMLGVWVVARHRGEQAGPVPWRLAAVAGLGDTAGNAFFVLAAALGRLDVAGVLGALYPAATVLLARIVLGERLTRAQRVGVGMALAAVVFIAL